MIASPPVNWITLISTEARDSSGIEGGGRLRHDRHQQALMLLEDIARRLLARTEISMAALGESPPINYAVRRPAD
jgi:hypothetical protein